MSEPFSWGDEQGYVRGALLGKPAVAPVVGDVRAGQSREQIEDVVPMSWKGFLPTRRWLRFGLRSLLIVMLVLSAYLAWYVPRMKRQGAAVRAILDHRNFVSYEYWRPIPGTDTDTLGVKGITGTLPESTAPPAPAWLRRLIGDEFFDIPYMVGIGGYADRTKPWSDFSPLADLVDVVGVSLSLPPDQVEPALITVNRLPRLRYLAIDTTSVKNDVLRHLVAMPCLEEIRLLGNVTGIGMEHLRHCENLKYLDLQGCFLSESDLDSLCQLDQLWKIRFTFHPGEQPLRKLKRCLPYCVIVLPGK